MNQEEVSDRQVTMQPARGMFDQVRKRLLANTGLLPRMHSYTAWQYNRTVLAEYDRTSLQDALPLGIDRDLC